MPNLYDLSPLVALWLPLLIATIIWLVIEWLNPELDERLKETTYKKELGSFMQD